MDDRTILRRLGEGEPIGSVANAMGVSRDEFQNWWNRTVQVRATFAGSLDSLPLKSPVTIARDAKGIPHIFAENDADLFFAYGWAMAQDRLFQLDYARRKGQGRLAEVFGPGATHLDTISRTVGLHRIAAAEWDTLRPDVQAIFESFAAGINAWMEQSRDLPPIEFDLLDYRPEPWSPIDSLAAENEFRWYLTGRFPIIVMPELAKRTLGPGPLLDTFLLGEADDEAILSEAEFPAAAAALRESGEREAVGQTMGSLHEGQGSNNWVLAGSRTETGKPLLASDPHIAFEAVSCWYEAHLCGGSFNVAGMGAVAMPAIMFGRNENVAWGITNNICSQRDLYQETISAEHPGCFLYDGQWEPAGERIETIRIKGADDLCFPVQSSRNGPLVHKILPAPANQTGPVSLKWLGAYGGGWCTALLDMNRAETIEAFHEAMKPWHVPTFSLVIADNHGNISYRASGRIPIRQAEQRGYRDGSDPADAWQGYIPFDAMPATTNPAKGWIASANNRTAPASYPFPLYGRWSSGWRAIRIRELIAAQEKHDRASMAAMHLDCKSLRGQFVTPRLVEILDAADTDQQVEGWTEAVDLLRRWDYFTSPDSVATTLFNVFYTFWCETVCRERFPAEQVPLLVAAAQGCAGRLLRDDDVDWFAGQAARRVRETFADVLEQLRGRFGSDINEWTWGRLHRMPLKHVLSSRGELGQLLDHGGDGVRGDMVTVCNTGSGPDWIAATGAGYRLVADLSIQPPVLHAVDGQGQSGCPGSPNYADQFEDWRAGRYHVLPLQREAALEQAASQVVLKPA